MSTLKNERRQMAVSTLRALIEASDSRAHGRGRPKKERLSDLHPIQFEIACEVEKEILSDDRKTGAITRAVKRVADRRRPLSPAYVRKAWQRQVFAREWARTAFRLESQMDEIRRRMLGLPQDVQDRLKALTVTGLLDALRVLGIDGTAPKAFIDAVRAGDLLSQKGG